LYAGAVIAAARAVETALVGSPPSGRQVDSG
jgi:hypothetical protein